MKRIILFSILLVIGLVLSQFLPLVGDSLYPRLVFLIENLAMICLGFIMIQVGLSFTIDKNNLRGYAWDYVVAATTATFPWAFCAAYFIWILPIPEGITPDQHWKEALIASRFAAPTSAGVLFSMLAAAGLGASWLFRKARVLAIFDDLDTILLMIPLQIMLVGFHWEMLVIILIMTTLLTLAWTFMHQIRLKTGWEWLLFYSFLIVALAEAIEMIAHLRGSVVPIHIEILLPTFVLGVMIRKEGPPEGMSPADTMMEEHEESFVAQVISGIFMLLVGLSMPPILQHFLPIGDALPRTAPGVLVPNAEFDMSGKMLLFHVLAVTFLANLGKMFPTFCYRKEASINERIALSIGMWPRGEVGAGVIVISLSYGIGGPMIAIAVLSLALNLLFTGVFIAIVKAVLTRNGGIRQA